MRKLVAGLFISVDGVTEAPDVWQEHFDEDMLGELLAHIDAVDAIILGRVTYEEWMPYWTSSTDEPFASHINLKPKYIASKTLSQVTWGDYGTAQLLKGDVLEEIRKLKASEGKDIAISGSQSFTQYLLENEVLDELTLYVHPVIAGTGKRLFRDGSHLQRLKLLNNKTTRTGTAILHYEVLKKS